MATASPEARPLVRLALGHLPRERPRAAVRSALKRRHWRLVLVRTPSHAESIFRRELVDAVIVDTGTVPDHSSAMVAMAERYPAPAWLALSPYRPVDAPTIAACAAVGFDDVLAEGADDALLAPMLERRGFTARFAAEMGAPPHSLGLAGALQRRAWETVVGAAGRISHTEEVARSLGVTREHLSRSVGAGGAPPLKELIDLVRLLSALELARGAGLAPADVCRVLAIPSPRRLGEWARRLFGAGARDLQRRGTAELVEAWARTARWRSASQEETANS